MSLIFKATNPGATTAIWPQPTGWRHEAYFDKPDALSLDMAGYHGVADRAIIEAYLADEGDGDSFSDIVFRGYVLPIDEAGEKVAKVSIPSIEKILDGSRWTVPVRYPAGTTLTKMLTHDWPASSTEKPGLLCMANNMVQPGSFVLHSGNVWKLGQGGSSFLGSLQSKHVFIDSVQQTWGSSAVLSSGQFWQDAEYLYIYLPDSSKDDYNYIILVEGIYETNIRLGTIENGSTTFAYSWRVGAANIYKEITRLILATGQEWEFSHCQTGYTYLNAATSIGRGASNTNYPTYRYDLCEIIKQKRNTTGGARPVHALRGEGIGKGQSKQYYTEASFPQGLRFVERAEYSSQFADQLAGTIGKLYDNYQDQSAWKITAEDDPSLMPGDWIKIVPEFEQPVIERVKQITRSSDSPMAIYVGQRPVDAQDSLNARMDWRDQMQRDLDIQYAEVHCSDRENVDSDTPCTVTLKVDAGDWDTELPARWLLTIGIGEFEAPITTVTTPEVHHGSTGANTTTGSGGDHDDHSLAGVTSVATVGNYADVIDAVGVDYVEVDGVTVVEDVTFYNSVNEQFTTKNHVHGFSSGTYPGSNSQFDLDTYSNPAQSGAKALGVEKAAAAGGTDSWVAWLTVTAKIINATYPAGVNVAGSPFSDQGIGDSIPDIDVSDLVVAGENKVQISISRYDTPGPGQTTFVKARMNVNLTGKIILDYSS